jgi:hypothetical protein
VREALRESFGYYRADSAAECDPDYGWRDGPGKCVRQSPASAAADLVRTEIAVRDIESRIWASPNEILCAFDRSGKALVVSRGTSRSVTPTEEQRAILREKGAGGTVTHNHPDRGGSFSYSDLGFACQYKIRELRAVDRDYRYSIKRSDGENFAPEHLRGIKSKFDAAKAEAMVAWRRAAVTGEAEKRALNQSLTHGIWAGISKELELDYRREPQGGKRAAE